MQWGIFDAPRYGERVAGSVRVRVRVRVRIRITVCVGFCE
jgi:hypothetical protein